jgi:hypothetical protein
MDEGFAVAVISGGWLTVTVTEVEVAHPLLFFPVTLYVVVEEGFTVMVADVSPVLHT